MWTPVFPADKPPAISDATLTRVNDSLYLIGGWREAYTDRTPV
jgi:hypothetical protein